MTLALLSTFSTGEPVSLFANKLAMLYLRPMTSAEDWIRKLGLASHVEGGYYGEIFRASQQIPASALPAYYDGPRSIASVIHFLLKAPSVSRLHRLRSNEVWLFHTGAPLALHIFDPPGGHSRVVLGVDIPAGEMLATVVRRGSWFGATVEDPAGFSLVSCAVMPGFEFADFELADRDLMLKQFPRHRDIIERLTAP
jgi:uncharacterized protein